MRWQKPTDTNGRRAHSRLGDTAMTEAAATDLNAVASRTEYHRWHLKHGGRVWIAGEMEFPADASREAAYQHCAKIAEACGYVVRRVGSDRLEITGGGLCGFAVCDWFGTDKCQKVEFWHAENVYLYDA